MAILAQQLFNYTGVKILLLSATPYKMYTMYHESQEDDHYQDFIRTVGFLFNSQQKVEVLEEKTKNYRRALYNLNSGNTDRLDQAKLEIETSLKKVMVRTERLAVTENRDGMVVESKDDLGWLTPQELKSFTVLDQVATHLEVGDTVEYWKSAPYLLNFMDKNGYRMKEKLIEAASDDESCEQLRAVLA
ncbi:MAG: DEAD/DEAH box helicase, partial [Firmicutes bacterium]|nr:DEAD/DEAH box helicase [Bacillota bacterium]